MLTVCVLGHKMGWNINMFATLKYTLLYDTWTYIREPENLDKVKMESTNNSRSLHYRVRCTINRSHLTPCKKAEFEHLQIFPGHCLDFFLSVSGKICHSPIKKVKIQPTLIISFSQHSPFFGEQSKNPGWNPTRVIRYLGSVPGSLWQNSPHKDAFFCISLTNIDQGWITCTFKVE